ncbi:hypothetical protein ZIOFF_038786 [Zingiber officinale]|uniref:Thioredoxin domain-containing protein n=1 Tax=Zingiber officinale TaxID=94328 RepID=A0A8J5L378_ZINOF|nr:hypothetical protein ZIOFF_038786 [Zingiber officinale]
MQPRPESAFRVFELVPVAAAEEGGVGTAMAEEGVVFACHTVEEWTRQLELANESKKLVGVIFRFGRDLGHIAECKIVCFPSRCEELICFTIPVQLNLGEVAGLEYVVIDFTASWCGPCRMIAPIFADLAMKFPNVIFLKVDIDELKTVAQDWAIDAMPTFVFLKEGTIVDKIVGALKEELSRRIELHLPS